MRRDTRDYCLNYKILKYKCGDFQHIKMTCTMAAEKAQILCNVKQSQLNHIR